SGFDLAGRDALRLGGLESVLAESQRGATLGFAVDAALMGLAELSSLRLQHNELTFLCAFAVAVAAFTARFALGTLAAFAAFGGATLVSRRIMFKDFALEDPDLDADDAVSGFGFGSAVVDIGTQGVQRHAAFAVPFGTGDVGTAETTTDID